MQGFTQKLTEVIMLRSTVEEQEELGMVKTLLCKSLSMVLGLAMLFAAMPALELTAAAANVNVSTLQQLKDAIAAAPITAPGNTSTYDIEITANIQFDGELVIAAGKNIKIWSASPYTLKAANNKPLITVNGTLILKDYITLEGTGIISSANSGSIGGGSGGGGGVLIGTNGAFEMNGGKIWGFTIATRGGGVCVEYGTFTMSGGEISDNAAAFNDAGSGVYVFDGEFNMTGGVISGNTGNSTSSYGGGIYVRRGMFTMDGGEISNNIAKMGGGVFASSTFVMNGGKISGNTSDRGGGVCVTSNGVFTMNGGEISNNIADEGGGVALSSSEGINSKFTMTGGIINGNTARRWGSGVYIIGGSLAGSIEFAGTPVINDGVYVYDALSSRISVKSILQSNARVVIEGSGAANQMRVGVAVANYTGPGGLTEAAAKAFVSKDGNLFGAVSGSGVVWADNTGEEDYKTEKNITVNVNVDTNTHGDFQTNQHLISVRGAAFSATGQDQNVDLHFSKPPNNVVVDGTQYKTNTMVQVDIQLAVDGVPVPSGTTLDVPIEITVPVPSGLGNDPSAFRILHFLSDGSYEIIVPTLNGDGTCTFIVDHFSVFAFVNLLSGFGANPPTGIADITGTAAAMYVFLVLSVALWGYIFLRRRTRNG